MPTAHQVGTLRCFRASFPAVQVAPQPTNRPTRLTAMMEACTR